MPELIIIVVIVGILAAIAIPKFYDLMGRSYDGATKGALSSMRSAMQVYSGDNSGRFPADKLECLTINAKYIAEIPMAKMKGTGHVVSSNVAVAFQDGPGWFYANDPASTTTWGSFMVNCTHVDEAGRKRGSTGMIWSTF